MLRPLFVSLVRPPTEMRERMIPAVPKHSAPAATLGLWVTESGRWTLNGSLFMVEVEASDSGVESVDFVRVEVCFLRRRLLLVC
jgi:hypothetical protein